MFDGMEPKDWWMVAGAVIGPFLAVFVTRIVDGWREFRSRREAVFVALMSTRRNSLTAEHVQAVNRIEIEFSGDQKVMAQLRVYMTLLEDAWPSDQAGQDLMMRRRRRAFADLMQAIAQTLGRKADRLDIIEGGYHPGGWAESELLQNQNLRLINLILQGKLGFPVLINPGTGQSGMVTHDPNSPFPPPPPAPKPPTPLPAPTPTS